MRHFISVACLFFVTSTAVTCAAETAKPRILDGANAPVSQYPNVGMVNIDSNLGSFFGTGTLIAPQYVLTAGHVVCDDGTATVDVLSTSNVMLNGVAYPIAQVTVNPTYTGKSTDQNGEFDAALIKLATPITSITTVPINRQVPVVGSVLTIIGYGNEGTGANGENNTTPPTGTVEYGIAPVDQVLSRTITWTFRAGYADTGHGDSGGPGMFTSGGVARVLSIDEGGDSFGWGSVEYEIRVDAMSDWIDSVVGFTDLTTGSGALTPPGNSSPSQPVTVSVPIINQGNNAAPPFTVTFRLSADTNYHSTDPLFGTYRFAAGLAAHSTGTATATGNAPATGGTYYITWKIDSNSEVKESDTYNNTGVNPSGLAVIGGPPAITSASTASASINSPFSFQVTGTNAPTTFTATGLPTGLTMDANGLIKGSVGAVGSYTINLTISNSLGTASGTLTLTVSLKKPVITWGTPAPIQLGAPLTALQLDATADVPGQFVYSPPLGTVLPVGTGQTLSLTFTPTDTNYAAGAATVVIDVVPILALNSGLTVSPVVAGVGDSVTFTASANTTVGWIWDFGDGTSQDSSANSITHQYTAPGVYTVTATAVQTSTNQRISTTATVVIGSNSNKITDAAGIPDEIILAAGSLPTVGYVGTVDISKMQVKLYFMRGTNSVSITGSVTSSNGNIVTLANQPVIVDVGGIIKSDQLTKTGTSKTIRFNKKGVFSVKLSSFDAVLLKDEGLNDTNGTFTVPVVLIIGNQMFKGSADVRYTTKITRQGMLQSGTGVK